MEVLSPGVLDTGIRACGWCGEGVVAVGRDVCGIGTQVGKGVVVVGGCGWLVSWAAVSRLLYPGSHIVISTRLGSQLPYVFAIESRWQHEW